MDPDEHSPHRHPPNKAIPPPAHHLLVLARDSEVPGDEFCHSRELAGFPGGG